MQPLWERVFVYFLKIFNHTSAKLLSHCIYTSHRNTLFQQHKRWLLTWTSPEVQYWNQIYYIFCSWRWRGSIESEKERPGADCGSSHVFFIAKFRLKLKKVGKSTRPFKYDLNQTSYDYSWKWKTDSRNWVW